MAVITVGHVEVQLVDFGQVDIPYWQVDGEAGGPCLFITAAQHGCEVQGVEVLRRAIAIASASLHSGRVVGVPFCNKPALWKRRHHISSGPERPYGEDEGHNMNRTWPGKADGNDTERLSHAIYSALSPQATHHIDIHCWSKFTATTALPRGDRPDSIGMARISGLPFASPRPSVGGTRTEPKTPCTIGACFNDSGRASLTFELAGQYVIKQREVRRGLRCVLNVMRHLGMLPGAPEGVDEGPVWLDTATVVDVKCPLDGLFVEADLSTADWVEEGQPLGHVISDADLSTTPVLAPLSGRLSNYGCRREHCDVSLAAMHPYASAGDLVASVAAPADDFATGREV